MPKLSKEDIEREQEQGNFSNVVTVRCEQGSVEQGWCEVETDDGESSGQVLTDSFNTYKAKVDGVTYNDIGGGAEMEVNFGEKAYCRFSPTSAYRSSPHGEQATLSCKSMKNKWKVS